jgi:hypothetical protein
MTPRPIHRRISFLLGLIVLVFLIWAWHASYHRDTGIGWGNPRNAISIGSAKGIISLNKTTSLTSGGRPPGPRTGGLFTWSHELEITLPQALPPVSYHSEDVLALSRYTDLEIAQWFIILLYLLTWLGTITWHHHRQRRLLEKHASAPAP